MLLVAPSCNAIVEDIHLLFLREEIEISTKHDQHVWYKSDKFEIWRSFHVLIMSEPVVMTEGQLLIAFEELQKSIEYDESNLNQVWKKTLYSREKKSRDNPIVCFGWN